MPLTYQPAFRVHGTTTWINFGQPVTSTSVLITGLSPSTQYDFQITSINAFGSTPSTPISATTPAVTTINSIGLAPQTFSAGSAIGTTVGTVTVTMSSGNFTGALTVTGTDAGSFTSPIVGNLLKLAVGNTTVKTYSINIVATQSGVTTFTQPFSITATSAVTEASEGALITTIGPVMNASLTKYVAQSSPPWNVFALINTGTGRDPQISLDTGSGPQVLPQSGLVAKLAYHNHVEWQFNGTNWYWWDTASSATPDKFTLWTINSVNLSGNGTYTPNLAANQPVSTVSVVQSDGQTFQGTYSVVSTPSGAFKMVGAVLTSNVVLSASSYSVTVTATPNVVVEGALSTTVNLTNGTVSNVQVPLGIHLGNGLFSSAAPYGSTNLHWNGVISAMGRTPAVLGATGANTFGGFAGGSPPPNWGAGDLGSWQGASIPTNGSVTPLLTWSFTDGTTDQAFSAYAAIGTASEPSYGGQKLSFWIQNSLTQWKNAGFTKVYIRVNWEFQSSTSTGGPIGGFGVGSTGNLPIWRNAWRGFCNAAHGVSGLTVKMVWCPATANDTGDPAVPPFGAILNYFPAVNSGSGFTGAAADGFAPAAVGGKFVDVIGPDLYAFGGGGLSYPDEVDPTSLTTTTAWFFDSCVKIAQSQGLTFGISEFGDFSGQTEATARAWDPTYSQGGRTGGWTPNHFFNYMNNLKNLSPAVPIEFICIYDVNVAPLLIPFSNMSQTNSDLMGYRKILGLGGTAPTPIMTIAVP